MGYASSYCEICGGPTNTTVSETDGVVEFEIGPRHGWLARVVGLLPDYERGTIEISDGVPDPPRVIRGEIDDHGTLTTDDGAGVTAGWMGGYSVVHESCWEIASRPHVEDLAGLGEPDLAAFQQQYFDFEALDKAGEAWKLDPPLGTSPGSARNKARLEERTAPVRDRMAGRPPAEIESLKAPEDAERPPAPRALPADAPDEDEPPPPPEEPAPPPGPSHRRLEKLDGTTRKFWEVRVEGASFEIRFGDVGGAERLPFSRDCKNASEAAKQAGDLVKSRLADGFTEVASPGS